MRNTATTIKRRVYYVHCIRLNLLAERVVHQFVFRVVQTGAFYVLEIVETALANAFERVSYRNETT